ncbi:Uncharacterised protein [Lelliottia amnigena]|nr:Uncharacterised protein [Lelliottia amnigena]
MDQGGIEQTAQQAEQQRQRNREIHRQAKLHHDAQRNSAQADGRAERNVDPTTDNHQRQRQRNNADADKVAGAEQQHVDIQHARINRPEEQDFEYQQNQQRGFPVKLHLRHLFFAFGKRGNVLSPFIARLKTAVFQRALMTRQRLA